jgi:hypothetical protein
MERIPLPVLVYTTAGSEKIYDVTEGEEAGAAALLN